MRSNAALRRCVAGHANAATYAVSAIPLRWQSIDGGGDFVRFCAGSHRRSGSLPVEDAPRLCIRDDGRGRWPAVLAGLTMLNVAKLGEWARYAGATAGAQSVIQLL